MREYTFPLPEPRDFESPVKSENLSLNKSANFEYIKKSKTIAKIIITKFLILFKAFSCLTLLPKKYSHKKQKNNAIMAPLFKLKKIPTVRIRISIFLIFKFVFK